jgi:hypothetical protein
MASAHSCNTRGGCIVGVRKFDSFVPSNTIALAFCGPKTSRRGRVQLQPFAIGAMVNGDAAANALKTLRMMQKPPFAV